MPEFEFSYRCASCPELSRHIEHGFLAATALTGITLDENNVPDGFIIPDMDGAVYCTGPRKLEDEERYVCPAVYGYIDLLDCDK